MIGECPECGLGLLTGGSHVRWHQNLRHQFLLTIADLLTRQTELHRWLDQLRDDDLIGFRWRNGVYPGWQLEDRWELPREWWDDLDTAQKQWTLRVMRIHLTDKAHERHGITVNPATWFHKMYDPDQRTQT